MPLQISLLKEEDKEKEKERKQAVAASGSSSSASTSTTGSAGSSIISSNLKSGSSGKKGSSSSSSSSSKDKTVEQQQPETEELAPVVKPNQLKTRYKVPGAEQPQTNVPTLEDRQAQIEKIRSQKWYSGDTPTEVEILAQITRIAEVDYDEGLRLSDMYLAEKKKGTYNQTYSAPTSQYMTDLGIDPSMLTDETIAEFQAYINEYGVNTASGGVSTAKSNGREAKLAGQLSALLKDHADTKELLAEQDKALNEAAYWIAQGLTNDEIIKKLAIGNGGKYTKLNKLYEKSEFGEVVPTTQAIALGTDYGLLGALYEMRNPDKNSGDILLDAVNAQLGRGAQSKATPAEIARRTPGDKSWAPYATGTTMHDDAMLFGVTGFDRKWLDENYASIAASGDQEKISAYGRIYDAVERTEKAQEEAAQLIQTVETAINSGTAPERIFTDELLDDYPTLKKMDDGQKSLQLVDIAYPVDFDMYALRNEAEKAYNEYKGTLTSEDYTKELDASTGASSPVYEGDRELDKEEEKNSELVRQVMLHTQTPAESSALKVFKPGSYRVMASAASGISAGGGGLTEAYKSAIGAANDYAGDHYLNAASTLAGAQQQLDALEKPVADFVDKWFPGQDKTEVVAKLASGQMQYPDDPEFNSDYSLVTSQVGSFEDFQTEQSELKAQIINEQTILDNITAQFASAEELNTSGAESQSVMPMLNYIGQFSTYDAKQDYASFGDWQYDVELNGVSWDDASKLIGERKENNLKDLEYIDTAIQYAEDHGVDETILTSMRRARDVIETDNQSIDYAQMRNKDGFEAAVEQFNSNEELEWFAFEENSQLKNALIGFEDAMKDGLSEEAYLANPHIDKNITPKISLMTADERNTYKYLYESEGADAATEFFHFIDGTYLTNRASEYRQMRAEEETKKHPILMNAVSIMSSPYQVLGIVEVARSVLTGEEINPNSEWFAVGKTISQVRETSQNEIVNHFGEGTLGAKIGTFGYQVVTSIGDSLVASPVGGAVTMGLTSFANTAMEATEKGGDKWDVILYAGINGLAETATEYLPMGALEDAFKAGGKQGVQGLLKSMASGVTEAPGEMLNELISGLADEAIMGELSQYQQNVAAYVSEGGMAPEEAEKKAREDFWKGVGMAGLQGLVAGSVQTTVGYAGGWALQSMQRNSDSKNAQKNGAGTQKQNTASETAEADTAPVDTQSAEQASVQPVAEAAAAVSTDAALVEATETPVEPVATEATDAEAQQTAETATEPTAEAAEAGAQQPTETAGQTTSETAAPAAEQPTRSGSIIRMVATLATCQKKGVSIADRAATVQAVLEAGGLKPDVALAMAKLVAGDGGKLQKLQQLVQKAGDTELGTALKAEAYRLLAPSAKTDGMSDADVVRTVESDTALSAEVNNAVMNSAIASETVNVLAGMDKTGVNNALNGMRDAKRDLSAARKRYNAQQNALENARQALQNANAQMRQNPGDSKLTNRTLQAAKELAVQQKLADDAQADMDAAKQRFDDAKAKAQEESSKLANEARGAAKQNVEQRMAEQAVTEQTIQTDSFIQIQPQHTLKQQEEIKSFHAAVDERMLKAAEKFKDNPGAKNERVLLSEVGERESADLNDTFGLDVTGYTHTADKGFFRHVEDRHGENGAQDQSMKNLTDVARVGWVLENYDSVEKLLDDNGNPRLAKGYLNSTGEHMPLVRYKKQLDGAVYVVEAIGDNHWKRIWLVSAYMQKNSPVNTSQSATVTQTPHAEISLGNNVQNENASPAENIIPGSGTNVNTSELDVSSEPALTMNPQSQQSSAPSSTTPTPSDGMGVSQFAAQTGQNTSVLAPETKQKLLENPYYQKTSQKKNMETAVRKIEAEGYETRREKLLDGRTDLLTPEGQVEAYALSQIAKERGDAEGQAAIAFKVKDSGTLLAQSLALRAIYNDMAPEAKVSYVKRMVDQINGNYESKGKDTRVEVPSWLEQALLDAGDNETEVSNVLDRAYREIAQQMPYSVMDTLNTWRFLSMLGNPLTHVKNMMANMAFMPYVSAKNRMAGGIESGVNLVRQVMGKDKIERSKTFAPLKKQYKDFAKQMAQQYKDVLSGNEKASKANGKSKIDEYRQKAPAWIDKASKLNGDLLGSEDMIAKNHYFKYALASYLQANNADLNNVDEGMLSRAVQYAVDEAYKNTFNNVNEFAKWMGDTSRGLTESPNPYKKSAGILLEGTLPFKNTPANIVSRGVEYSPIGLLNAVFMNARKLKKGTDDNGNAFTTQNYIDGIATGTTGTVAMGIGALLASVGILDLGADEDDEVRGINENSINLCGRSVGIDWAGTAAMPLLMGATLWERWSDKGEEPLSFKDYLASFKSIADPVMDLSMVQGVTSLLETASYSDNALGTMATKMATSYMGQFVPTVLGAITRTFFDDTRRTTYTDKNSELSSEAQYLLQSMRNKIPGLSKQGMPYMDAWGNEQTTESVLERFLTNFLIPGYPKKTVTDDEVTNNLLELFDEYGDSKYLPTKAKKKFTVNGETYNLTQEEYTQYAKERGSIAHELLSGLMANERFQQVDPEFQLSAITDVWTYSTQTAAKHINSDYKANSWVVSTDDPLATILENMDGDILKAEREKLKASFFDAYEDGDLVSMQMCAEGLKETGYRESDMRSAIKTKYRQAYIDMHNEGDMDGMRDLRDMMMAAGLGFKVTDFSKWLEK